MRHWGLVDCMATMRALVLDRAKEPAAPVSQGGLGVRLAAGLGLRRDFNDALHHGGLSFRQRTEGQFQVVGTEVVVKDHLQVALRARNCDAHLAESDRKSVV